MKTIKSTLIGVRQITAPDEQGIASELKAILAAHRDVLINHLLTDINSYVLYKKSLKLEVKAAANIRQRLVDLKKTPLDLNRYTAFASAVQNKALVHVDNAPFYAEIDESIELELANETTR